MKTKLRIIEEIQSFKVEIKKLTDLLIPTEKTLQVDEARKRRLYNRAIDKDIELLKAEIEKRIEMITPFAQL